MDDVAEYHAAVGVEVETRLPEALVEVSMLVPSPERVTVPVAVKLANERLPENRALPWTERVVAGEVVAIPTEPLSKT